MSVVTPADPGIRPPKARERVFTTSQSEVTTAWSRLGVGAASARGLRHRVNEDSYSTTAGDAPVFVVADGVGGGAMAAWASRKLVVAVQNSLGRNRIDEASVRAALLDADRDIAQGIASHGVGTGAATVAVCAATGVLRTRWIIAWVGDCRVYRIDGARAPALLTSDDTYRHLGEEPPPGGSRDDPARMIGNGAVSSPNIGYVGLQSGEMLVLVSDGVHKHVEPEVMARTLHENTTLARGCLRIVEIARANGSEDDATALVVHRRPHWRMRFLRRGAAVAALVIAALVVATSFDLKGMTPAASGPPARPLSESSS
ncbi:MAG: protein phosphatase 2C domain-containing protein [Casimicrobiaceae bacterium]